MPRDPRRHGFTLLELLTSMALAMMLMGLAWTGFIQLRTMARANQAAISLAVEAGYIHRRFDDDVSRTMQQAQWRLETPSLDPAIYDAGDRAVRLIGMMEMPQLNLDQDTRLNPEDDLYQPTLWYCWEWRPPTTAQKAAALAAGTGTALGSLWYGRTSSQSRSQTFTLNVEDPTGAASSQAMTFKQSAQPRRSRRRDLEDNDLRLLDGAANAPAIRLRDDRVDLVGGGARPGDGKPWPSRLKPVSARVTGFSIAWVAYDGEITRATVLGLSTSDAAGNAVAATGDPWWNATQRVVDGYYRDGRDATVDHGHDIVASRPGLVRLSFTLVDQDTQTSMPFIFSLCPDLAAPAATGM